jgi:hypothetical protein
VPVYDVLPFLKTPLMFVTIRFMVADRLANARVEGARAAVIVGASPPTVIQ